MERLRKIENIEQDITPIEKQHTMTVNRDVLESLSDDILVPFGYSKVFNIAEKLNKSPGSQEKLFDMLYRGEELEHVLLGGGLIEKEDIEGMDEFLLRRAVILSEPEREYEEKFFALPNTRDKKVRLDESNKRIPVDINKVKKNPIESLTKEEVFYKEIDISADITVRLSEYVEAHNQELWDVEPSELYARLSRVAFGTDDVNEINQRFSQMQRRGFRLAVVNFIDRLPILKSYKNKFETDPKEQVAELLGETIVDDVNVEFFTSGIIITLSERDYGNLPGERTKSTRPSKGLTLSWNDLPVVLQGNVIVVKETEEMNELSNTIQHEKRHVLFNSFLSTEKWKTSSETLKMTVEGVSIESHRKYAKEIRNTFTQLARDEFIAYASGSGRIVHDLHSLGNKWERHLEKVEESLDSLDITKEEKVEIYHTYFSEYQKYLQQVQEFLWISEKLYERAEAGEGGLTEEKWEALLQNTHFDKMGHLVAYLGMHSSEVNSEMSSEVSDAASVVKQALEEGRGIDSFSEQEFEYLDVLRRSPRPEVLPVILDSMVKSSGSYTPFLLKAVDNTLRANLDPASESYALLVDETKQMLEEIKKDYDGQSHRKRQAVREEIKKIEDLYERGFPLSIELSELKKSINDENPETEKVIQLVHLLPFDDKNLWERYFGWTTYTKAILEAKSIDIIDEIVSKDYAGGGRDDWAIELLRLHLLNEKSKYNILDSIDDITLIKIASLVGYIQIMREKDPPEYIVSFTEEVDEKVAKLLEKIRT